MNVLKSGEGTSIITATNHQLFDLLSDAIQDRKRNIEAVKKTMETQNLDMNYLVEEYTNILENYREMLRDVNINKGSDPEFLMQ